MRVKGPPLRGDLHRVADSAASFNAGVEILQEALGNAFLVGPYVDGFAANAGAGLDEESAGAEQTIVFGVEDGHEAEIDVGAKFRAIATQVLIDQAQDEFPAGYVRRFRGKIGADEQIRWAGGVFAEMDENAGVGAGFVWLGRCAEGVVSGGINCVGLDGVEGVRYFCGRDRLTLKGPEIGENLLLRPGLAAIDADLPQSARRSEAALVSGIK